MSSDKEKRSKAEALLSQFKQETSKIEGLDLAIQQYLYQTFSFIVIIIDKILHRMCTPAYEANINNSFYRNHKYYL